MLDRVLRALAPEDELLAWHAGLPADQKTKDDIYEVQGKTKPTRTLRARYIAQQRNVHPSLIAYTTKSLGGAMKELQGVKHAGADTMGACVETVALSIEACLLGLMGER